MGIIRTMVKIGIDDFSCPIYKCEETGILYKDITLGSAFPELYSCCNSVDGDPDSPISPDFEIHYTETVKEPTKEQKFNYMLLSRLQSDCEYFLGFGNKSINNLWSHGVSEQIKDMRELWNGFAEGEKPEWLTMEQIDNYERLMTV